MALSILNNVSSITARANLQGATKAQSTSIKRLSTGLRINQASDDASGLAISEKMRTQIRGLNKASENSQNGISMLQTAEGALNETHSILQRMRELAVQASNGTLTSNDRIEVQKEVDALKDEIDGISKRTEFNTKKLLTGDATGYASFSTDKLNATFTDGKVQDGEYQLEIDAKAGTNQVQATSIFRVKEGVQSVKTQELNASPAEHTLTLKQQGLTATQIDLKFTIDGKEESINATLEANKLTESVAAVKAAFDGNANLSSKMDISVSGDSLVFTMKDNTKDFKVEVGGAGAAANLEPSQIGVFEAKHSSSKSGIAELNNVQNLVSSPNSNAKYNVIVDKKGGGTNTLDRLETVKNANTSDYSDDIYHVMGSKLQEGSTGFSRAKLDFDLNLTDQAGAVSINFNFDGNPKNTINFNASLGGATNAEDLAKAINNDNRLNGFITAEQSGDEVKLFAIDENRALDYKVSIDGSIDGNNKAFNGVDDQKFYESQFVTGMGKLGTTEADAFTASSNSHHGTDAIIEFTTDGKIGEAGLNAKVSFDGGKNWSHVKDVWDKNSDKLATDGKYKLEFNKNFTNNAIAGNFQAGDRLLIAMNDNANDIPSGGDTYNELDMTLADGNGKSNMSMDIEVNGEKFSFNVDLDTSDALTAKDAGNSIVEKFNKQVGSNGTKLSDVVGIDFDGGTSLKLTALKDDFSITTKETGSNNITAGEGSKNIRFHDTDGTLTRVDSFDPSSGKYQMGVVTSHPKGKLSDKTATLNVASMDEKTGQVNKGSVDAKFNLEKTGILPTDGEASFSVTKNGGGDVQASTKLKDIDRFYNADGQFILGQNGETFSIYNARGDKADVYIDGGDSLNDVVDKMRNAITKDVSEGGLGMSTGDSNLDKNIVSFVKEATSGSTETQQGSIVIRSANSGNNGRIFVSSSEALKTALGLSEIQSATENELTVTVKDNLTGKLVGSDTVTDNILHNVVKGVEVEVDQDYDIKTNFDESTKNFTFSSKEGTQIETMKIVDNSTDFQIGANQGQTLNVNIMQSDAHSLKIDRVQVTDQDSAKNAITQVDKAIDMISSERAKIGAWVNRLEHTMANLDVQTENQTAAESRIRDLNIAKETTKMSKSQILAQASTSMLAQANQQSQGLMSLLR